MLKAEMIERICSIQQEMVDVTKTLEIKSNITNSTKMEFRQATHNMLLRYIRQLQAIIEG